MSYNLHVSFNIHVRYITDISVRTGEMYQHISTDYSEVFFLYSFRVSPELLSLGWKHWSNSKALSRAATWLAKLILARNTHMSPVIQAPQGLSRSPTRLSPFKVLLIQKGK